jgi:hypothetical protein
VESREREGRLSGHDELLLRRFVACRDTGDAAGAQRWWRELVELNFDRVRSMVDLWGRGGRLSADEREEATQLALVKLWHNMVHSFHGRTMGEWVNATALARRVRVPGRPAQARQALAPRGLAR